MVLTLPYVQAVSFHSLTFRQTCSLSMAIGLFDSNQAASDATRSSNLRVYVSGRSLADGVKAVSANLRVHTALLVLLCGGGNAVVHPLGALKIQYSRCLVQ